MGFPGGSVVKNSHAKQEPQEMQVPSLGGEVPLEEEMAATPVFLPGNSIDRGAWQATVHGVAKSQIRLSD